MSIAPLPPSPEERSRYEPPALRRARYKAVHPTSHVGGADLDLDVTVAAFVVLAPGTTVGARTVIEPHVTVGPNVRIGADCHLQAGCRIGQAGFGYEEPVGSGWWGERRPHDLGVVLEDEVHVGANACIDAGSWRPTLIRRRARIDNLVHVAHNVIVGEEAMIVALAEISGSVEVGRRAWVAPSSSVRQRLRIGELATVGLGAAVVSDVPDGETWAGVPARRLG